MNRFRVGAAAFGAVTVLAVAGMPGQALAQSAGGFEHFTITQSSPSGGPVLAYGAFNASGTDVEHGTNPSMGTGTFHFPNGTVNASHTSDPGGTFHFNPVTCVGHFTGTGDYTLTGGTGAYRGIRGHGEFTLNGTAISAHTAHGCGQQIGQLVIVKAQGAVSFGTD